MTMINPDLGPDPVNRLADGAKRSRPMSRYQVHKIFREMVRGELANGRFSARRRRRLVHYAASLRISAVEAGELIQEVVRAEGGLDTNINEPAPHLRLLPAPKRTWPTWAKLTAALAAVLLVNLLVLALFAS